MAERLSFSELVLEELARLGLELGEEAPQVLVVVAVEIDLVEARRDGLGDQRLEALQHVFANGENHVPPGRTLLSTLHSPGSSLKAG